MNTYELLLYIEIPSDSGHPESFRSALSDAGCEDIRFGDRGPRRVSLNLTLLGNTLAKAFEEAEAAIQSAVPNADIIGVIDLKDIDELADLGLQDSEGGEP